MGRLKSKGNKATLYPTKTGSSLNFNFIICQNLLEEVEDHALTGSKLPKQKVQLTRIFKL